MRRVSMSSTLAACILLAAFAPAASRAQPVRTTLTVSGFPTAVAAPTGTDFLNGSIQSAPITFTVDATNGPALTTRTATVSIRCALPCPNSGPKTLASLQWRRGDLGTWNGLTTSDVVVESRSMTINVSNDPWANTILFRFLLNWTTDAPGSTSVFRVTMTLTVTSP